MEETPEVLLFIHYWKFALPLFGAIIAWFANEWRKRLWEQYQRKEASYKNLVRSLRGFYVDTFSEEKRVEFLDELNQCWLYCPDDVIVRGYRFLDTVHTQQVSTDQVKEKAMGEFMPAIRRDLLSRNLVRKTTLTHNDFRHFTVTRGR